MYVVGWLIEDYKTQLESNLAIFTSFIAGFSQLKSSFGGSSTSPCLPGEFSVGGHSLPLVCGFNKPLSGASAFNYSCPDCCDSRMQIYQENGGCLS